MTRSAEFGSLFALRSGRKPWTSGRGFCAAVDWTLCLSLTLCAGSLLAVASCAATREVVVRLDDLERSPHQPIRSIGRLVASDPRQLARLTTPLGPRAGLVQVRTPEDWRRLARAVSLPIDPPDLENGMVVGLSCVAGLPLDADAQTLGPSAAAEGRTALVDEWPLLLRHARTVDGGGMLEAEFRGGTYLVDGTTFLDLAYIPRMRSVLVVDVNGLRFYP